jgi:RHS repeat-associated protein
VTSFEYDSCDRLVRCATPDGEWSSVYDPLGRRICKSWQGATTEYYWDDNRLAAERTPDGHLRIYVYVDAGALVPFMFLDYESPTAPVKSGRQYFISTNQIGTPIRVEDEQGRTVWRAKVDPYGIAHLASTNTMHFALRFPGHQEDAEIGLFYNRFRHYSPALGRYLQSDPMGIAGGKNLYSYPANPLTSVDIFGLHPPKSEDDDGASQTGQDEEASKRAQKEEPPNIKALLDQMSEEDRNRILARTQATDKKGRPFGSQGNPDLPSVDQFDPRIQTVPAGELEGMIGDRTKHGLYPDQQAAVGKMNNDDLVSLKPQDPISATQNDDGTLNQTGGHHRAAEIANRVQSGDMDPNTPVPVMIHE